MWSISSLLPKEMTSCYRGFLFLFFTFVLFLAGCAAGRGAVGGAGAAPLPEAPREFRAAWIATVSNIDWPSAPGLPVREQKAELRRMLDQAAALNLNAVIFQVRPAADALYDSPYEPWSAYLTGQMGQPPEPFYDPLAFAVEEAHARGLELHAWFNPYRARHPSDTSAVPPEHVSRAHPAWVIEYGTHQWLDPGMPEAQAHTLRVILDVVARYDVDGVHFDDYFYPYRAYADGADFPDSTSWRHAQGNGTALSRADWRRSNVNHLVEVLYRSIKKAKPHVKFGISPFGIWRPGNPPGTTGFDAYDELYADARKWLREGWVDYLTPQLYYRMDQTGQPYPIMLRWWTEQNKWGRRVWPGNFTSRVRSQGERHWTPGEIVGQVYATRAQPGATGNVHFSMKGLMPAPDTTAQGRLTRRLREGPYAEPALVPAMPWLDERPPARPALSLRAEEDGRLRLHIAPSGKNAVRWWVVRLRRGAAWTVDVVPGSQRAYAVPREGVPPDAVAVSAVDRAGNESQAAALRMEARPAR